MENLPRDMESAELKEIADDFAKSGKLASATILRKGEGELEYTTIEDMREAIKKLERRRFAGGDERLHAYEKPR